MPRLKQSTRGGGGERSKNDECCMTSGDGDEEDFSAWLRSGVLMDDR